MFSLATTVSSTQFNQAFVSLQTTLAMVNDVLCFAKDNGEFLVPIGLDL